MCFNFLRTTQNFEMLSHIAHIAKAPQANAASKALSKSAILLTHKEILNQNIKYENLRN
jgi:hypothetical protein